MSSNFENSVEERLRRRGERLLGLFFRAWAHELNNPVQAVLAGAELIELELGVPDASMAEIQERVRVQAREVAAEVVRVSEGIARLHALCRPPTGIEGKVHFQDMLAEASALWGPVSRHAGLTTRFPGLQDSDSTGWVALPSAAAVLVLVDALTAIWQGAEGAETVELRLVLDQGPPLLELVFDGVGLADAAVEERRSLWNELGLECELGPGRLALRFPSAD
jgi:signal transduction histidine kinase